MNKINNIYKKKVLFFSYLSGLGGGERFLLNHISELKAIKDVFVVINGHNDLNNELIKLGIPIFEIHYKNKKTITYPFLLFRMIFIIIKIVRTVKPEIIHVNDIELGKIVAICAKILNIPVIWTCHGWWYTGLVREFIYNILFYKIVFVSNSVRDKFTYLNKRQKNKCIVIHPGINTNEFKKEEKSINLIDELQIPQNAIVVSIIGRMQEIKGHDVFLKAASIVLNKNTNAFFLIVGGNVFDVEDDNKNIKKLLGKIQNDNIIKNRIKLTGFCSEINKVYSISDIVVCASYAETFGMVVLEAMSCGCAVISTNVGGPSEIITKDCGILINPGNPVEMANAILHLLSDSTLREKFGNYARLEAKKRFELKNKTDEYLSIYN